MVDEFERWAEEHYQAAYRFAFSLCGNHDDACDLTQQAFVIAQKKLDQVREASKRKAWLFTVLRREFLHSRRRRSARDHHPLELVEAELPRITVDHAALLDAQSAMTALQSLEEHYRVALSLFYFEQLSYKEIAEALDTPIGTVMSRLARGKEVLRQRLQQTREELGAGGKVIPLQGVAAYG